MRTFVDTNVLVYLYDVGAKNKRSIARELFVGNVRELIISTQVLNEFFVTVTRKFTNPLSVRDAAEAVAGLAQLEVVPITRNLVIDAITTGKRHQLSHWDSLMVEAAARSGAVELLTEDLAAGSSLAGVKIVNPFDEVT